MGCGGSNDKKDANKKKANHSDPVNETGDKGSYYKLPQDATQADRRQRLEELDKKRMQYRFDCTQDILPPWADWPVDGPASQLFPPEENPDGTTCELIKIQTRMTLSKLDSNINSVTGWLKDLVDPTAEPPFERYNRLWDDDDRPAVSKVWKTDEEFGRQRLMGMMPTYLRKVVAWPPPSFKGDDVLLGPTLAGLVKGGKKLADLVKDGRLYYTSHPELEGVESDITKGQLTAVICAPIVVFVVADTGKLMPVAIQPFQDSAKAPTFAAPTADGKAGADPNVWLGLKIHATVADFMMHGLALHAVSMHMVFESLWIACCRSLAPSHPLVNFLRPHFDVTIYINQPIRGTLGEDGDLSKVQGGYKANWATMKNYYDQTFHWQDCFHIPHAYEKRGTADMKGYWYKDDALRMWKTHRAYVKEMVLCFYKDDEDVVKDSELQEWMRQASDPALCGLKGLPLDSSSKITNRTDLVDFLTAILFQVSSRHSYVEASALDYYAYAPCNPGHYFMPIPTDAKAKLTEREVSDYLPPVETCILQRALIDSVNLKAKDFHPLGKYHAGYMHDEPKAEKAVDNYRKALEATEKEIKDRNAKEKIDFPYFLPSNCFSSIWN